MSFAGKWMELEIMLIEKSQTHKDKHHMYNLGGKLSMKLKEYTEG
jgi:hypothetical protein